MKMREVEVISSCLVKAKSETNSISRLELNPWNLQFLLLDPIQKGILFLNPPSKQTLIHHLKSSLSKTLDFFPPLAGRLACTAANDSPTVFSVVCNNAGAEYTHAAAAAVSVSDILEAKYTPEIVSSFFPLNGIANLEGMSAPLLGVQVTELVDGVFIACTANHVVVDGTSFWHFINSWSEISRGFDTISKPPVFKPWFPRSVDGGPLRLPPVEENSLQSFVPQPPLVERVFHFSRESIAKLKSKANLEAGTDDKISSLQALLAHLWRSVARCRRSHGRSTEAAQFTIPIGARGRIPLPEGYFGTAVYIATIEIKEVELLNNGLGHAAMKIHELVSKQTEEAAVKFVEDWGENPTLFKKGRGFLFVISSSPRFDVYGNDFGWGKPVAVRSGKGQKMDGKMTVYRSAAIGGIDVEACLAMETLQAMEDDADFMEAFL